MMVRSQSHRIARAFIGTEAWPTAAAARWLTSTSATPAPASGASSATELAGLAVVLTEEPRPLKSALPISGLGPLHAYREGITEGLLRRDPLQEATVHRLQRLYDDLSLAHPSASPRSGSGITLLDARVQPEDEGGRPWWSSLFSSVGPDPDDPSAVKGSNIKGLYMFGGVGCGKTMLMDLFAACAPSEFMLERTHFHDFMLDVHSGLRQHQSTADPLALVADDVASHTRVLCLDEFFVTDVADAMILHRLFGRLWDRGLVLVATSNRRPDALYEGGLQRDLFMPFIRRLKDECEVHDMASPTDYRQLAHHRSGLYFVGAGADEDLHERFIELTNSAPIGPASIDVAMGRQMLLPRVGGCIAYFDFKELCDRPLGAADFIALANAKHTIAVAGVPIFNAANRTAGYRFVTLIDVLYEHKVRLLCSAEGSPVEIFQNVVTNHDAKALAASGGGTSGKSSVEEDALVVDDNLGFAKDRTVSRLTEMQSGEYLAAHAQAHAPELLLALKETEKSQRRG